MPPWDRLRDLLNDAAEQLAGVPDGERAVLTLTLLQRYQVEVAREVDRAVLSVHESGVSLAELGRVLGGKTKQSAAERVAGARRRLAEPPREAGQGLLDGR